MDKEGDQKITIVVEHGDNEMKSECHHHNHCHVRYRYDRTPHIYNFIPQASAPNTTVKLRGSYRMSNTKDLYEIKLGDYLCDRSEYEDRAIHWWHQSRISCDITPEIPGGYYNLTLNSIWG